MFPKNIPGLFSYLKEMTSHKMTIQDFLAHTEVKDKQFYRNCEKSL